MKIISNLKKIVLLATIGILTFSCNNDDAVTPLPPDNSIAGIAQRNPNLSVLVQALSRAGLVNTLSGTGPFTVFAPTNAAFTSFLANSTPPYANLEAVPVEVLKDLLLNHVVSGSVQSSALTTGYIKTLAKGTASTTNTLSMFVNTASGVRLNGVSSVTTPNILASNGVIHVVDAVIGLPTIVTHTVANPSFNTLESIVTSSGQTAVLAALSASTPAKTVFAPTDAAFATATGTGGWANGASASTISKVLQYHVTIAGNVLSTTLTNNQSIPMITDPVQNTTVIISGNNVSIRDGFNVNHPVIATDVQCSNGVIHAVSGVLRPN